MTVTHRATALAAGLGTGIGSLPHTDAAAAAELVLRVTPDLPAIPQLPARDPREGLISQWAAALPEVEVHPDGTLTVASGAPSREAPVCRLDDISHGGLAAFVELAAAAPPPRVKAQVTGPLTLGRALAAAGMPQQRAYRRALEAVHEWARVLEAHLRLRLPGTAIVLFFDEPALADYRGDDAPLDREAAVDLLSAALAAPDCVTGVHVCGDGELGVALEAGPDVLGIEVRADLVQRAVALSRFLDGEGWIAWGAVPSHGPVGTSADPYWRAIALLWCELTRRGCDPLRLRSRGLVTPACGLAGHGVTQAERALRLAYELGERVHDQAVATRLSLGA